MSLLAADVTSEEKIPAIKNPTEIKTAHKSSVRIRMKG
jgi:hypothetical protein